MRKAWLLTVLCSALLFEACAKENDHEAAINPGTEDPIQADTGNEGTQSGEAERNANPLNLPQFTGELDFRYVADTDSQPALGDYPGKAYAPEGIYFRSFPENTPGWALQYYDYASEETVYVCSKSNCSHGNRGCDAYFESEIYDGSLIWWYENNLYTMATDGDYVYLERISPDGAVRERSCTLMRLYQETETYEDGTASTRTEYPLIHLHRGYAYFSTWFPGCSSVELLRVKLDSEEEAEQLLYYEAEYPLLQRVQPQGRYVLFEFGNMIDGTGMELALNIYAYDTEGEGTISLLCERASGFYTVIDNRVFYSSKDGCLHRLELDTGESEVVSEELELVSGGTFFEYEGSLVYQFSTYNYNDTEEKVTQQILDQDGNVVDTRTSAERNLVSPY